MANDFIEVESYGHPGTHAPEIITQDENNRFVTDVQVAAWDDASNAIIEGDATIYFNETKVLSNGQLEVVFVAPIRLAHFFLSGENVDNGRLVETVDFGINLDTNTIILARSYPSATYLTMSYMVPEDYDGTAFFSKAANLESVVLIDGQTTVPFLSDVSVAAFFINGSGVDNGRLIQDTDYTVDLPSNSIVLTESYPADTIVTMSYIDAAVDTLTEIHAYDDLGALRGAVVYNNAIAYMKGYATVGDGGGGEFLWDNSDLSAKVTAEVAAYSQFGTYIPPTSDDTGASGAWKLQGNILNSTMFGITGSPEGVVISPVGKTFLRTDGSAGATLYIKESGTGNTGWVAK